MGVTIHYRGRLDDISRLPRLCDELADIAASMKWETMTLDDDWTRPADAELHHTQNGAEIRGNLGLKGIQLVPLSDSDSISFFFDREGNLRTPIGVVSLLDGTLKPHEAWAFVKTQFGSPEEHAWICGLLRYVKRHYIADLEVTDEGDYWDTGDMKGLREKMAFLDEQIDRLTHKLANVDVGDVTGLTPEEIASKIEDLLDNEDEEE